MWKLQNVNHYFKYIFEKNIEEMLFYNIFPVLVENIQNNIQWKNIYRVFDDYMRTVITIFLIQIKNMVLDLWKSTLELDELFDSRYGLWYSRTMLICGDPLSL